MISFLNVIILGVVSLASLLLNLLPNSPFRGYAFSAVTTKLIGYLNWLIPFHLVVTSMLVYVGIVALWYVIRWGMRFVKFIE